MRVLPLGLVVMMLAVPSVVHAQPNASYRPFGSTPDPASASYARWSGELQNRVSSTSTMRPDARPQLAGLRPKSVELMEDGLLRKHPKLLANDPAKARELLLRRAQRGRVPQLRGYMAEAMFIERNPDWGYVRKANATQHDAYRWVPGQKPPLNAQIKYHDSGKPSLYAKDMVKDHRAPRFVIPDDHVESTKAYLRSQGRWRDANRIQPLGATSQEIRSATTEAYQAVAREKYSTYVSLGASLALSFGPTVYGWTMGDIPANIAAYRVIRSLSLMGVGIGAEYLVSQFPKYAIRGTVRGNVITGTAMAIVETGWLLHEHGWQRAFTEPSFYEDVAGSVSGLALGLAAGTYATGLAAETGPWAPVIGAGVGIVTGTIGYLGGKTVAMAMMDLFSPEMLRRHELERLSGVKQTLQRRLDSLQKLEELPAFRVN